MPFVHHDLIPFKDVKPGQRSARISIAIAIEPEMRNDIRISGTKLKFAGDHETIIKLILVRLKKTLYTRAVGTSRGLFGQGHSLFSFATEAIFQNDKE